MYNSYFGFSETPFAITPDPRFLYLSPRHQDALAHLQYGLYESNGFVLLTGEVGTGKTALCRYLLANLPADIDAALILNPRQTALELVANICDEMHISYPKETTSIKVLIDLLNQKLLQSHTQGRRTVLIIDEAQNLSHEVLEQVRLLTNLETSKHKLLQILLIGQPELNEVLARSELRQLTQRITARYHIAPLTQQETTAYIQHRIGIAGVKRPLFTKGAIQNIHRQSHGIPRLVNTICDRALLGAYGQTKAIINTRVSRMAAKEVLPVIRHRTSSHPRRQLTLGLLLLIIAVSLYSFQFQPNLQFINQFTSRPAEARINPRTPPQQTAPTPIEAPRVDSAPAQITPPATVSDTVVQNSRPPLAKPVKIETVITDTNPLDQLFEDANCDSNTAFSTLFQLWDKEHPPTSSHTPCEAAEAYGLHCLHNKGTWNSLRRYNRPSILEMQDSSGKWHHLLLNSITEDSVTLSCGVNKAQATITQADRYWLGEYLLLWQPPGERTQLIMGDRGPDVAKIKKQLMLLNNDATAETLIVSSRFDAPFKQQVIAFQQMHSLTPDGIAGKDTLILLNTLTGAPSTPLLQPDQTMREQ
ncbi:AAA family ATPase [Pseudomonadota bacterium]